MKKFITVGLMSLALVSMIQASAEAATLIEGASAQEIYGALNVQAVHLNPGAVGAVNFQKKVGGLDCREVRAVRPGVLPKYRCSLETPSKQNPQKIYEALNLSPIRINPTIVGSATDEKRIGGLVCQESRPVVPRAVKKYSCSLN